jgi:hypothetical protein
MALTKADISEHLFNSIGLSKREAKDLVELYFQEVCKALESAQQVKLCIIKKNDPEEIPKQAKRFLFQHVELLLSEAGKSSARVLKFIPEKRATKVRKNTIRNDRK